MKPIVLDTGIFINIFNSVTLGEEYYLIPENATFVFPTFIFVEVFTPFKNKSTIEHRKKTFLKHFGDDFLNIIYPTERTFEIYKELQLFTSGLHPMSKDKQVKTIGHHDLWIASICYENDFHLYTCDSDFDIFKDIFFSCYKCNSTEEFRIATFHVGK